MNLRRYRCVLGHLGKLTVLVGMLGMMAFEWPWEAAEREKREAEEASRKALAKKQVAAPAQQKKDVEELKVFFDDPTEATDEDYSLYGSRMKAMPSRKVSEEEEDPEIAKVREQIEEIMRINQSMKLQYANQAAEIHKISEQAKIHKRLLNDLQTPVQTPSAIAGVNVSEVLRQEKLRLIREQTASNRRVITDYQKVNRVNRYQPPTKAVRNQ